MALAATIQTEHHPGNNRMGARVLPKSQWRFRTASECSAALAARQVSAVRHRPACRRPRFPLGLSPQGLPVGAQIVGPWLEDRTPLKLAELIAREFGGFNPPPMFDD
jgi:hypothetical protein